MVRSKLGIALIATLLFASCAFNQPTSRRTVPIEPLLRNSDPRLVALGAWEVLCRQDDTFIPLLQSMVEQWDPAQKHRYDDADRFDAITVVLDVLIQRNAVVSPAGASAIAYAFPDQALILAARLPPDDAEPLLRSWYVDGGNVSRAHVDAEGANRLMMSRVAAMMLAKLRPQNIAAALLADSVEHLAVSVPNLGLSGVERCLVGCEAAPACVETAPDDPQPGWPPIFQYHLEEYRSYETTPRPLLGDRLISAGGDIIASRRIAAGVDANYCHSPAPLDSETRHHLLAEMLGITNKQMPWTAQMNLTLPWLSDGQFVTELGNQVDVEETRLRSTVQQFLARGLISKSQADGARPKLLVTVFDDRQTAQPANHALPRFAIHAPFADSVPFVKPRAPANMHGLRNQPFHHTHYCDRSFRSPEIHLQEADHAVMVECISITW